LSNYPWLPALLFWAAIIFTFVMAVLPRPPKLPGAPSDKIQHAVAFATLGLLAVWAYPGTSPLLLVVLLSLFGALIELIHTIPAFQRDSDLLDWLVDTVACGLVITFVSWFR
jgi:VanZ family protein